MWHKIAPGLDLNRNSCISLNSFFFPSWSKYSSLGGAAVGGGGELDRFHQTRGMARLIKDESINVSFSS